MSFMANSGLVLEGAHVWCTHSRISDLHQACRWPAVSSLTVDGTRRTGETVLAMITETRLSSMPTMGMRTASLSSVRMRIRRWNRSGIYRWDTTAWNNTTDSGSPDLQWLVFFSLNFWRINTVNTMLLNLAVNTRVSEGFLMYQVYVETLLFEARFRPSLHIQSTSQF